MKVALILENREGSAQDATRATSASSVAEEAVFARAVGQSQRRISPPATMLTGGQNQFIVCLLYTFTSYST